jgi:predicted DNA-binding transcriptional regulator AlpA
MDTIGNGTPTPHKRANGNTRHRRADDELLQLAQICELLHMSEATVRWKRHKNELPFVFRMSRRLVAWKSDVLDYIESYRLAEEADRLQARA